MPKDFLQYYLRLPIIDDFSVNDQFISRLVTIVNVGLIYGLIEDGMASNASPLKNTVEKMKKVYSLSFCHQNIYLPSVQGVPE